MEPVVLQKLPYPYKAALAICSDIDGSSFETFVELHRFLNTRQHTSLGDGVALPVGNSFWMYDHPDNDDSAFSYFSSDCQSPSKYASIIRDFIQAGILDVLHTYGNFSAKHLFSRNLASRALEELEKQNCKIRIWTNHGGKYNPQKIGEKSGGMGDILDPDSNPNYHADLLHEFGIRFFWDSEWSLTQVVGQGRQANLPEAFWKSPIQKNLAMRTKSFFKAILEQTDRIIHKVSKRHISLWNTWEQENVLIKKQTLRDEHQMYQFKRFGHARYDWSDDLDYLLNNQVLELLLENQGYLILYIHLGDLRTSSNRVLDDSAIRKFRQISDLYHGGKIWVGTTSQLLVYKAVTESLDWEFDETDMLYIITIHGLKEQTLLDSLNPSDLQGITFQTPVFKETIVKYNNQILPTENIMAKNRQWVKIPIRNLQWPLD